MNAARAAAPNPVRIAELCDTLRLVAALGDGDIPF
jgi:hypothetical protein